MNTLYAIGDSFTYGEELIDKSHAWPQVLGSRLGYQVINAGEPASSNDKIVRKTLEYLTEKPKVDLVVIGWSLAGRSEYADETGYYDIWPGSRGNLFKHSNSMWRHELINHVTLHHNMEAMYKKFLQQVILMQRYLESLNIKYIMLNVLQNDEYKKHKFSNYIQYHEQVNTETFLGFDQSGMIEWANGCSKGPRGHFLEDGHQRVADKIYEHIGTLGWLS